jgi:hypothetical protein
MIFIFICRTPDSEVTNHAPEQNELPKMANQFNHHYSFSERNPDASKLPLDFPYYEFVQHKKAKVFTSLFCIHSQIAEVLIEKIERWLT